MAKVKAEAEAPPAATGSKDANDAGAAQGELKSIQFIESLVGEHPSQLVAAFARQPGAQERVRKLLGAKFSELEHRLATGSKIVKKGNFVVAEGCAPHQCGGISEIMVVFDVAKNKIHVGLISDRTMAVMSEDRENIPPPLKRWPESFYGTPIVLPP